MQPPYAVGGTLGEGYIASSTVREARKTLSNLPGMGKSVTSSTLDDHAVIIGRYPDKFEGYLTSTQRQFDAVKIVPTTVSGPIPSQAEVTQKLSALPQHLQLVQLENKARREAAMATGYRGVSYDSPGRGGVGGKIGIGARTEDQAAHLNDDDKRRCSKADRRDTF